VARNRLLLLAVAAVAAAVVVIVLVVVSSGGGSPSGATTSTGSSGTSTTATGSGNLFAGIPQHGETLGDPKAAVTLTVYEDPQCPFCREWALDTLPSVLTDYVRTGRIKLSYRGIEVIGPNSQKGLAAIYAAAGQNKLWNFAESLYRRQGAENSGWITDAVIRDAATSGGADARAILAAASSASVTAAMRSAARTAEAAGVQGTPTFILEKPPGLPQELQLSALDVASFESALEQAL
jgi:protein-disulfide isomerase